MPLRLSHRHSLRFATLAVLLASFVVLAAGQYSLARWWYGRSLGEAEAHGELMRARHAQALIADLLDNLGRTAWDQATWDDSYTFMQGTNPGFPQRNLAQDFFVTWRVDAVAFVRLDGSLVHASGFDFQAQRTTPPPAGLASALTSRGAIGEHLRLEERAAGLALLDGRVYAWGSAPVLMTGGKGNPLGYFLLLRELGPDFEHTAGARLGSTLRVAVLAEPATQTPPRAPGEAGEFRLDTTDDQELRVTLPLGPADARHTVALMLATPREVHAAAVRATTVLFWTTLLTGLAASLLALFFVEQRLLRPLHVASAGLAEIGDSGDLSGRLAPPGHDDEMGVLVRAANHMLAQLEESRRAGELARDAAVVASRVKSDFLARMSHEIRTPMNGVLGMTELLQRSQLNARQRKYAETIHRSADSLLDIINDILDFSKMEAGRLELQPVIFDLVAEVEETVELLAGRAHAKGLELVTVIAPGAPEYVVADPVRLRQVLTNLLSNAIKFTEHGEVVARIDARPQSTRRTLLTFAVADTGIGIPETARGQIFDAFTQADASSTRRHDGTGLGLAIAKQLVELMGGRIEVDSAPGQGATFRFAIEAGLPAEPIARARLPDLAGLRILIADDNAASRMVIGEQLRHSGAEVRAVGDGELALRELSERCDVLLLDDHMPEPGGIGLLPVLRADARLKGLKIVLLSSLDVGTEPGALETAHIDAYLTKPVRRRLLVTTVARLAGRHVALEPQATGSHAAYPGSALGLDVLLVEDNLVNRDVAQGMLEALGCRARIARDGAEALAALDGEAVDVVLMDCQMPVMDGFAATAAIRERETVRGAGRVPIIAVSAHAMTGVREQCLAAGMNEFLAKPFTLSELARILRRYARARRAAEPAGRAAG
jgi:signal transduction histidine kinase/DNA-binding response OmpR family regulator